MKFMGFFFNKISGKIINLIYSGGFFLRQLWLIKWVFFIHTCSSTPYIHLRLDSFSDCFPKFSMIRITLAKVDPKG